MFTYIRDNLLLQIRIEYAIHKQGLAFKIGKYIFSFTWNAFPAMFVSIYIPKVIQIASYDQDNKCTKQYVRSKNKNDVLGIKRYMIFTCTKKLHLKFCNISLKNPWIRLYFLQIIQCKFIWKFIAIEISKKNTEFDNIDILFCIF